MSQTNVSSSDSLTSLSIKALQTGIQSGKFSVMEVTHAYLDRIAQYDEQLNSYITIVREQATQQALEIDNQIRAGQLTGTMAGVPYALKDLYCTKGTLTTCASKMLSNFIAPYDAHVAEKLKTAGGVLLGKNNMDEFAMGSSNENSFYGAAKNPWNIDYVPGGSSGGSAAAVAARLAPLSLGSDTGGSIRQPAAFCGITGLKPTYGRISRFGMVAFASSLDQCGLLASSAEDCALGMNIIAGFDERDSTSAQCDVPDYTATLSDTLAGLRIGLPKSFFAEGLDNDIAKAIDIAVKTLEAQGATISEITLPNCHLSVPVYYIIAPAECSSNLSRFDGVRYGYRCDHPENLDDLYQRSRWEGFGEEVKRRIMIGTYALSSGYYDAYYLKAQQVRRVIKQDFIDAFQQVDVIMGPVAPTTAFKIGEKVDNQVAMYLGDLYTIPLNLAGLPGMSIPVGFAQNGMPIGMQLIGNYFAEAKLLNIAHQYQQLTDWHTQMPMHFV